MHREWLVAHPRKARQNARSLSRKTIPTLWLDNCSGLISVRRKSRRRRRKTKKILRWKLLRPRRKCCLSLMHTRCKVVPSISTAAAAARVLCLSFPGPCNDAAAAPSVSDPSPVTPTATQYLTPRLATPMMQQGQYLAAPTPSAAVGYAPMFSPQQGSDSTSIQLTTARAEAC